MNKNKFACAGILLSFCSLVGAQSVGVQISNSTTRVETEASGQAGKAVVAPVKTAGKKLVIDGAGRSVSVPCNGRQVVIDGADNAVTLSGYCARLSVDGAGNRVTVDQVERIHVDGADNIVAWRQKMNDKAPRVSSDGVGNRIYQIR